MRLVPHAYTVTGSGGSTRGIEGIALSSHRLATAVSDGVHRGRDGKAPQRLGWRLCE
ncbi:hypothetical protein GCM10022294_22020 [Dietzia aurantiaca]